MTTADAAPASETAATATATTDAGLDELRSAVGRLLAAERRLRSRDHAPGELTLTHIRSLRALADGELTAGQLARSADLNPASVTAMLDHLEGAGIVARRRSDTDRRVCLVALTDEGHRLLDSKTAVWQTRWAEHLGGYDVAELRVAAQLTRDIAELLDSFMRE